MVVDRAGNMWELPSRGDGHLYYYNVSLNLIKIYNKNSSKVNNVLLDPFN